MSTRHARSTRSTWIASRARNALRRGPLMGTVGLIAFLGALVALAIVPRADMRRARAQLAAVGPPVDTIPLLDTVARWTLASEEVERDLAAARLAARERERQRAAIDSAGGFASATGEDLRPHRDSLVMVATLLEQLIARAEAAPLPNSYRAIGSSWALRTEPRAAALLDTLAALERERESFDASGSADPAYVALTTRVNQVGRELLQLAQSRRAAARAGLAAIAAQRVARDTIVVDDTTTRLAAAAGIREQLRAAAGDLARARAHNRGVAASTAAARRLANVAAPPLARLAAALVLGVVVAFIVSLLVELRRPRLADAAEAVRTTGARVLVEITANDGDGDRTRRSADRETPPLLDPTFERYRTLYLQVAATGAAIPLVTVTGDEPEVTAVVAANLAAASGFEARSTLLIDGDLARGLVSRVLRIPREPGLSAILAGDEEWARAIVATPVGRSRYIEAIPAGRPPYGEPAPEAAERVRRDLARYAARYDLCVLCAPPELSEQGDRALLPTPDVILCAREGHTTLARLREMANGLRSAGTRLRGVVVWRTEPPRLSSRGEDEATARRVMSWTETRQAVARR